MKKPPDPDPPPSQPPLPISAQPVLPPAVSQICLFFEDLFGLNKRASKWFLPRGRQAPASPLALAFSWLCKKHSSVLKCPRCGYLAQYIPLGKFVGVESTSVSISGRLRRLLLPSVRWVGIPQRVPTHSCVICCLMWTSKPGSATVSTKFRLASNSGFQVCSLPLYPFPLRVNSFLMLYLMDCCLLALFNQIGTRFVPNHALLCYYRKLIKPIYYSGFWKECFGFYNRVLNVASPCFGIVVRSGHLIMFECVSAFGPLRQFTLLVLTCSCILRSMVVGLLRDHVCSLLDLMGVFSVPSAVRVEILLTGLYHSVVKPIGSDLQFLQWVTSVGLGLILVVCTSNPFVQLALRTSCVSFQAQHNYLWDMYRRFIGLADYPSAGVWFILPMKIITSCLSFLWVKLCLAWELPSLWLFQFMVGHYAQMLGNLSASICWHLAFLLNVWNEVKGQFSLVYEDVISETNIFNLRTRSVITFKLCWFLHEGIHTSHCSHAHRPYSSSEAHGRLSITYSSSLVKSPFLLIVFLSMDCFYLTVLERIKCITDDIVMFPSGCNSFFVVSCTRYFVSHFEQHFRMLGPCLMALDMHLRMLGQDFARPYYSYPLFSTSAVAWVFREQVLDHVVPGRCAGQIRLDVYIRSSSVYDSSVASVQFSLSYYIIMYWTLHVMILFSYQMAVQGMVVASRVSNIISHPVNCILGCCTPSIVSCNSRCTRILEQHFCVLGMCIIALDMHPWMLSPARYGCCSISYSALLHFYGSYLAMQIGRWVLRSPLTVCMEFLLASLWLKGSLNNCSP